MGQPELNVNPAQPVPVSGRIALSHETTIADRREESISVVSGNRCVFIEPLALSEMLAQDNVRVVDVRAANQCPDGHIPGAVLLDYQRLVRTKGKAEGLLPSAADVSRLLSETGIRPDDFVVAYDDGAGVDAARLLWTLELIGHKNYGLLNGGFGAWDEWDLEIVEFPSKPERSVYPVAGFNSAVISAGEIESFLGDTDVSIVDTRSLGEFIGTDVRAHKRGHIPGAVHFEWSDAVDMVDNGRVREAHSLLVQLHSLGITPDKLVIVYCQTNRRSAHTWLVLRSLGYENIRAYDGSWSEWGNSATSAVEL